MKEGLVSVIMGIYNCAGTLDEAFECIAAQTYSNWELIMCDDGSTDDTYAVARRICGREPRARLIKNKENMGLAKTLNNCLAYATGEFIARMDGDDVCSSLRFERELAALRAEPDAAVVSSGMYFYDESGVHGHVTNPKRPDKYDILRRTPFCHAPCMMRSEALMAVGGYGEDDSIIRVEDYDLWYRMYAAGMYGINIPDELYGMREDRNAFLRKRSYVYRINEYKLKKRICTTFGLGIKYRLKTFRPLIVGFVPMRAYKAIHKRGLKARER